MNSVTKFSVFNRIGNTVKDKNIVFIHPLKTSAIVEEHNQYLIKFLSTVLPIIRTTLKLDTLFRITLLHILKILRYRQSIRTIYDKKCLPVLPIQWKI